MNRDVASLSALAAALLALAGCGGSEDATAQRAGSVAPVVTQAQAADRELARRSLLHDGDLPVGWAADPPSRRVRCRTGGTFAGVTARGTSVAFTRGNINIQQSVWIFRDGAAARAAYRAMNAHDGRACFRRQVSAQVSEQNSVFVEPLRMVRQRGRAGVRRSLLRGRVSRLVQSPFGGQAETLMAIRVDEIERHHGRGISTIVVTAAVETPDARTVKALVYLAGQRLGAAVARPES